MTAALDGENADYLIDLRSNQPLYSNFDLNYPHGAGYSMGGLTAVNMAGQQFARTTTRGSTSTRQHSPYSYPVSSYPSSFSNPEVQDKRYHCLVPGCNTTTARAACLKRHLTNVHFKEAVERYDCTWNSCGRKGENGFTRVDKLIEHVRDVHHADLLERQNARVRSKGVVERYDCTWNSCGRKGENGFKRHDKMMEHVRHVHHADLREQQNGGVRSECYGTREISSASRGNSAASRLWSGRDDRIGTSGAAAWFKDTYSPV